MRRKEIQPYKSQSSLNNDFKHVMEYRKDLDSAEQYLENVQVRTEKLLRQVKGRRIDETFFIHCINEKSRFLTFQKF